MEKVGAFSCLTAGLKALRPNLLSSFFFALLLSAVSTVPVFIDRMQGMEYLTPPISLWGFLMSLVSWLAQTLILVGVSQVVWWHVKKEPPALVHLLPSEKARPQIFLWSISFTIIMFGTHVGSWLLLQSTSHYSRYIPLPILPFVFYFLAFIPLMIADRQVTVWVASVQALSVIKANFLTLLKLALIAEAVFLTISVLLNVLQKFIMDTYSLPNSVVADQAIGAFYAALIGVINSAMMAVAYAEVRGLPGRHPKSANQLVESS